MIHALTQTVLSLFFLLTNKALLLTVPQRCSSDPVRNKSKKCFLDLSNSFRFSLQPKQKRMKEQLWFYLKRRIKHNQFGARGHQVIAAVRLHKPCVHIVLRV